MLMRLADAPAATTRGKAGVGRGAWRGPMVLTLVTVALVASVGVCVTLGSARLDISAVWRVIGAHAGLGGEITATENAIVWELRLPRVVLAMIVGAGLALVGLVMQTLMRNPLADPYLLGISSGASVGAVAVLVIGVASGPIALSMGAFIGALVALALVLLLAAGAGGRLLPTRTVLAGVAVGAFCSAITSFVLTVDADSDAARRVMNWSFGSLATAGWASVALTFAVLAAVTIVVLGHASSLNAFTLGEHVAGTLGVSVTRVRWVLLLATALLTATLVAVSGAIGFVGLIVPHAVSFVVPHDHRIRVPLVMLSGALFLMWVDAVGRVAFAPRELPIGVLTAIIGVPVFVLLLRRSKAAQ